MRLLTRSDFDGICCAALLQELGVIDELVYTHPKDLQDGRIRVTRNDVLANVPFVEGCGLWFDHHSSEVERLGGGTRFTGASWLAPSTARVIYSYYNDPQLTRLDLMVQAADKIDSGQMVKEEILRPQGWVLLGFLCDPRTGLGYQLGFRVANFDLMCELVTQMRTRSIDQILAHPDVLERIVSYLEASAQHQEMLLECSACDGPVVVTDTRGKRCLPPGNRFLVYALYPQANVAVRLIDGKGGLVSISVGYSVLNRSCTVDIGSLLLRYGGGGHRQVGTCQVATGEADRVTAEILSALRS